MEKRSILIVDDQPELRDLFQLIFKSHHYNCYLAGSAEEANIIIKSKKIDLILLDIMLGQDDGRELCKLIKQDPLTQHIKVILMSASPILFPAWNHHAADAFLRKPFEMKGLLDMVELLVS